VPFNSPSGICSFGKGAATEMTCSVCGDLYEGLPKWNFCFANQGKEQTDLPQHMSQWVPVSALPALFSTQL